MALWTGSLRICVNWANPKTIPPMQMMSPNKSRLCPDIPTKLTDPRSGIVKSASPAPAAVAKSDTASATIPARMVGTRCRLPPETLPDEGLKQRLPMRPSP